MTKKLTAAGHRKEAARALRARETEAEHKLWSILRRQAFGKYKFRRQFPLGPFFADFCCISRRLIIEVDGSYHLSTVDADENRTFCFEQRVFRVIRFTNNDVMGNLYAVQLKILEALQKPFPLPLGEGGRAERTGEA